MTGQQVWKWCKRWKRKVKATGRKSFKERKWKESEAWEEERKRCMRCKGKGSVKWVRQEKKWVVRGRKKIKGSKKWGRHGSETRRA